MHRVASAPQNLECRRYDRRHRRSQPDPQYGVGRMHWRLHRLRIALRRQSRRLPQEGAKDQRLRASRPHPARLRHSGKRIVRPRLRSRPQRRLRAYCGMDRRKSPGVCDISHPHTVSSHAAVSTDGGRKDESCIATGAVYDTGHAVFLPKHMSPQELEQGYAWIYQRLFSHASIWRRRPEQSQAIPLYLAMSYLYKRSNRFWHLLIKHDLVNPVWKPLVEMTRWRHVRYRRQLEHREIAAGAPGQVVWLEFRYLRAARLRLGGTAEAAVSTRVSSTAAAFLAVRSEL